MTLSQVTGENFSLLISQHITVQRFNTYIGTVRKQISSKQKIFAIRPSIEGLCPIYEAPEKSSTMKECGIGEGHDLVISESEEGHVNNVDFSNPGKIHTFYHNVARHYGIARNEYENVLPEIPEVTNSPMPQFNSPKRSNLPVEIGSSELMTGSAYY